jgi:Ras-related C3 botulinum toxin substrate 1
LFRKKGKKGVSPLLTKTKQPNHNFDVMSTMFFDAVSDSDDEFSSACSEEPETTITTTTTRTRVTPVVGTDLEWNTIPQKHAFKILFNGDGSLGKTSFLITMVNGKFPTEYIPTVFDNWVSYFNVARAGTESITVALGLWDTFGRSDYDRLRPLSYANTDLMLLCVDCGQPQSLLAAENKFLPEVLHWIPKARRVLMVLKTDLRDNEPVIEKLKERNEAPLSHEQCAAFAEKYDMPMLEVSALRGDGMETIAERLVELALETRAPKKPAVGLGSRLLSFVKTVFGGKPKGEETEPATTVKTAQ